MFIIRNENNPAINNKKPFTIEGLHEVISIRASLNKGLPERLEVAFSNLTLVTRP